MMKTMIKIIVISNKIIVKMKFYKVTKVFKKMMNKI